MLTICNNILSLRMMISSSKTLFSVNSLGVITFSFIKFIEVTLVHKIIQVSSVQVNKTSSAPCIVCYHLNSFRLSPLSCLCPSPPNPSVPFPSAFHHTAVCVYMYIYVYTHLHVWHACVYDICVYRHICHVCVWFLFCSVPSLIQPPNLPSPLTAVSLFHVSMPQFLFCASAYLIH